MSVCLATSAEKSKIDFYANNSFYAEGKKMVTCYQSLKEKDKKIIRMNISNKILLDAVMGGAGGAVAGAVVGSGVGFIMFNIPGIIPGAIRGAKIGGRLGTLGGLAYGVHSSRIEFMSSDKYKKWIAKARETDVYPIYQKIIQNDNRFKDFICMSSLDLITVPVKAPDGKIYEEASIVEWIKQKEEEIEVARQSGYGEERIEEIRKTISFVRSCGFGIDNLKYCPLYFQKLDEVIKIKIAEMEDNELEKLFEEAMQNLQAAQEENKKSVYQAQVTWIMEFGVKHDLEPKIVMDACKKLKEQTESIENEGKKQEDKKEESILAVAEQKIRAFIGWS